MSEQKGPDVASIIWQLLLRKNPAILTICRVFERYVKLLAEREGFVMSSEIHASKEFQQFTD